MPQKVLKHKVGLETHGLKNLKTIHWNLSTPQLYEHIINNQEGFQIGRASCRERV